MIQIYNLTGEVATFESTFSFLDFSTDSSSDDDDLPLAELKAKRMLGKENAKRKAQSQVGASRKTRGIVATIIN